MHLDENLPPERLNAPPLDAICVQRGAQAYIRQVELLHARQGLWANRRAKGSQEEMPRHHFSQAGYFGRSAQMSQKDVGAGGIHPLAGATGSMLAAREVGLPVCRDTCEGGVMPLYTLSQASVVHGRRVCAALLSLQSVQGQLDLNQVIECLCTYQLLGVEKLRPLTL